MKKFDPIVSNPERTKLLELFDNSFPGKEYLIIHQVNEFTSVCPKTGQPDFGVITISYVAAKKCVELKSLKYYMQSFRNEGIFYENVINRILDDLCSILKPKYMEVLGEFTVRGGLQTTIVSRYGKKPLNY
ncbi:preQ(1) synthase [soil metagenome]